MNQIDRVRIRPGTCLLHRLGPAAAVDLLADVANRIGSLPCIVSCLTKCEQRHKRVVPRTGATVASRKREAAR